MVSRKSQKDDEVGVAPVVSTPLYSRWIDPL